MPPPGKDKYFLALVPPPPLYEEMLGLKEYFKEHYGSKAALRSPPHITLHMPFEWKTEKEEKLISSLADFSRLQKQLTIRLNGFDCFAPRVIFARVEPNEELTTMQKQLTQFCKVELNLFNAHYRDLPFHPHLTVAFRDLKKALFVRAWEEFRSKSLDRTFTSTHIALLKHDGRNWLLHRTLPLN
jgi:2'-5' RNA ligase